MLRLAQTSPMSCQRQGPDTGPAQGPATQQQFRMDELPELVLAVLAKHSLIKGAKGHPMLSLARGPRDAVLQGLSKLQLDLQPDLNLQPLARLLNRACRQAVSNLELTLNLNGQHGFLPILLQTPAEDAGWRALRQLRVRECGSLHDLMHLCCCSVKGKILMIHTSCWVTCRSTPTAACP
jgi:hypothetical protein